MLILFLTASCLVMAKPASASEEIEDNSWAPKAPMHVARSGLGVAVVNGKIYAIGGNAENGVVGTNEEYDPETDTWSFKTSMLTPMAQFATAVYQNKIYCISENVNEVYDPATDTWETKEPTPTPRSGVGANVVNGKIYVTGGFVHNSSSSTGFSFLSLNEVYDPETDFWATKTEMPTAVVGFRSAVVNDKIYIIQDELNQIYDAGTDTWSLGTPLPHSSISDLLTVAAAGMYAPKLIYGFGGGETQVYDPMSDSWTFGGDMLTDRVGFGVGVVNDLFYVIGGFTETFDMFWNSDVTLYATNEQYTPFGYGAVPPAVSVASPENKSYASGLVSLNFSANKPVSWVGYSLDGKDNVTVAGNTTLSGLINGVHNVTVYARDEFGNTGVSETVWFSVVAEPFPTALVAGVSGASVAVIGLGLLVYFKKRKH
jgi:hypothetical protein